jgi:site-specific DNA-methyltransferase (adenine-specific)
MCGAGTTLKMAKLNGRGYLGFDISEEYCDIARRRIASVGNGETKY